MKLNFKGKSAVITGASGGMGLEISKRLSENNISVLMLDLQSPKKDFLKKNKNCVFKKVDVTNFNKMKSHIDTFYKKHKSLDYLVNTTGVLWFNKDVSAVDINSNIWDKVFEINLKSMMYLSKIIVPKMKKNKFGSNNIRSNIILPGPIETGMQIRWKKNPKAKKNLEKFIPLNRVGRPEDISNASVFLLSDQANYITGTELIVDGGITSKP